MLSTLSINSFALTVDKILDKIENTLEVIDDRQGLFDPEMNIGEIDVDDDEFDNLMFGNNVKVLLQDMDLVKWRQDLEIICEVVSGAKCTIFPPVSWICPLPAYATDSTSPCALRPAR